MSYFQFDVEGIAHEWDTDRSEIRFMGSPIMMMWIPPLADLMGGIAELMGPACRLAMRRGGRKSGEASFGFFEQAASLEEGLNALIHATRIAGWGLVELVENDPAQHRAVLRQRNSWEVKLIQQMRAEHGCLFFAGHWAGVWSKVFGANCWSQETQCQAHGAECCEFIVEPSRRTIEDELARLRCEVEIVRHKEILSAVAQVQNPVLQVWEGILTLPLVGELGDERARQVTETLLLRIVQAQAAIVIVDITGVPTVDTRVANHLMKAVRAAELLGAKCLLVGISPQIAQTLIDQNIPLYGITTCATLQQGLEQALRLLNLEVGPAVPSSRD